MHDFHRHNSVNSHDEGIMEDDEEDEEAWVEEEEEDQRRQLEADCATEFDQNYVLPVSNTHFDPRFLALHCLYLRF